jgi:hypothetical protein
VRHVAILKAALLATAVAAAGGCASPYQNTILPSEPVTGYTSLEVVPMTTSGVAAKLLSNEERIAVRSAFVRRFKQDGLFPEVVEDGAQGDRVLVFHSKLREIGFGGIARFLLGYGKDAERLVLAVSIADKASGKVLASTDIVIKDPGDEGMTAEALTSRTMKVIAKFVRERGSI